MKKKLSIVVALCLILLLSAPLSILAWAAPTPHVIDLFGMMTGDDAEELEEYIVEVSERYEIDIAVVSAESEDETARELAEYFYDDGDYGYGDDRSGILLLYDATGPETYVYLQGLAADLFTSKKVDLLIENFDSTDDGFEASYAFVEEVDYYLGVLYTDEEPESDESESEETFAEEYGRLVDAADLLSNSQEKALRAQLDATVAKYKCDVVIITVDSLDGDTAQAYADDIFDYGEYGVGSGDDGILLLLSIDEDERDWAISTFGFGIKAFTDWGQEYIMGKVLTYLRDDEYYDGLVTFATLADDFLAQARSGAPYDTNNKLKSPKTTEQIAFNIGVSVVIGLLAGAIVAAVLRSQLKSVKYQQLAHEYIRRDSFHVKRGNDRFLYKHVDRKAKPKNNSSGGGSTHSSSSGRSHGGSSGKF